ncbi:ribonuclease [Nocardia sp. CDC159]|uniref:Ribonuclease n=1 Tax=Nocardia pulmonis TaxID=2951408 RepID=A0A9X2E8P3_9NOCA|nr:MULTISPECIES: ribonuclease domain-containing protein [Nocardia]MCM6776192.1 ribonuclease [Nocardia pulmonis]MCM6788482.1 ribonuclease [Nocardia sp. CDC159]
MRGSKALATAVLAVFAAMTVLLGGSTQAGEDIQLQGCSVPDRAWHTLQLIDAGQWPPNDGSGTKGGTTWQNREGRLPRTDGGRTIHYLEWDVNRKKPGQSRDAERIVTGDIGTAWYTGDHYGSFCRMR